MKQDYWTLAALGLSAGTFVGMLARLLHATLWESVILLGSAAAFLLLTNFKD